MQEKKTMTLAMSNRSVDDVTVIQLEGKMNTATSSDADAHLSRLIASGSSKLLLNMEGVDYISSSGLRVILANGKKVGTSGGKIAFCSLNPSVGEVFRISGFNSIVPVFGSEQEALDSFQSS
jgi:anti-sigma B factor antagonist